MIIRTTARRSYTALPNSIFRDRRLQVDSRAVLAYLLTLPAGWNVRPMAVARALSSEKGRPIGKQRLARIFAELRHAGYMQRSQEQSRDDGGYFDGFVYVVGADPAEVKAQAEKQSVAFLPQAALPSTGEPSTADRSPGEPSTANPPTNKRITVTKKSNLQTENSEFEYGEAAIAEAPQGQPNKNRRERDESPVARNWQQSRDAFRIARARLKAGIGEAGRRTESVQHELAERLGHGDRAAGWMILGSLSDAQRDLLTAKQRTGSITERDLELALATASSRNAVGRS